MARNTRARPTAHRFGGAWTTTKLTVVGKYLQSYATALKDQPSQERPFAKAYIDAFAGTGYRDARERSSGSTSGQRLFPDLASREPQALLAGSARVALGTKPPFDRYIFIERMVRRCAELEKLKAEFPELAPRISVRHGEANQELLDLCAKDWRSHRAVMFLDPYGMQVEWNTLEAIAATQAIDLWLLFPLGIGVNRLVTRSGDIPDAWRERLNTLLGTAAWCDEFYRVETSRDLFGADADRLVKVTTETIGRYFTDRLGSVFPGVARAGVLRSSTNNPLYLLCFAAANERGAVVAVRIANALLKELR